MHEDKSTSNRLLEALNLASRAHAGQTRKGDGSAYINHLIEVAFILEQHGHTNDDLLVSAILHDVLEDTQVDYFSLTKSFGKAVADIVSVLTDDKALSLEERRNLQLKKARLASKNHKLIKLADGISNARLVPLNWSIERASSSLNHLKKVANSCEDACPKLADLLMKTVDESLNLHEVFVEEISRKIEGCLAAEQVVYSPCEDLFYLLIMDKKVAYRPTVLEGQFDVYLRSLRKKELNFTPLNNAGYCLENRHEVNSNLPSSASGKEPNDEPVFDSLLLVNRRK